MINKIQEIINNNFDRESLNSLEVTNILNLFFGDKRYKFKTLSNSSNGVYVNSFIAEYRNIRLYGSWSSQQQKFIIEKA